MFYLPLLYIFLLVGPMIAGIAFFRQPSKGCYFFLLSLCVFYGVLPLLMTWGAYGLAKRFGCVAEAVSFRCPSPVWLGNAISGLAMSHWLAIFAIPSAILGAIGLLISGILQHQRSRSTNATSGPAFYRSRRHKVVAGVCSALAERLHQPTQVIRIVTVVLAIVIPGFVFLYFWCWLAFPIEPRSRQLQPLGEQS
jgi:phage shock protein C